MEKKNIERGLSLYTANTLTNPLMKEKALTMVEAMSGLKRNTWTFADTAVEVVEKEIFKDDFGKVETFAKWGGVSKSTISVWKKAVTFAKTHKCNKDNYTVAHCIEYALAEDACKENNLDFQDFARYAKEQDKKRQLYEIPTKKIRKYLKEWLAIKLATDAEDIEEVEEVNEPNTETVEIAVIIWNGKEYEIPVPVLEQFAKEK